MEQTIAEGILEKYSKARNHVLDSRLQYLNKHNVGEQKMNKKREKQFFKNKAIEVGRQKFKICKVKVKAKLEKFFKKRMSHRPGQKVSLLQQAKEMRKIKKKMKKKGKGEFKDEKEWIAHNIKKIA